LFFFDRDAFRAILLYVIAKANNSPAFSLFPLQSVDTYFDGPLQVSLFFPPRTLPSLATLPLGGHQRSHSRYLSLLSHLLSDAFLESSFTLGSSLQLTPSLSLPLLPLLFIPPSLLVFFPPFSRPVLLPFSVFSRRSFALLWRRIA